MGSGVRAEKEGQREATIRGVCINQFETHHKGMLDVQWLMKAVLLSFAQSGTFPRTLLDPYT